MLKFGQACISYLRYNKKSELFIFWKIFFLSISIVNLKVHYLKILIIKSFMILVKNINSFVGYFVKNNL